MHMHNSFTKGLIAGTLIGTAVGMMFPTSKNMRFGKKMFRGSKGFIRKAGNVIEDVVDMWS